MQYVISREKKPTKGETFFSSSLFMLKFQMTRKKRFVLLLLLLHFFLLVVLKQIRRWLKFRELCKLTSGKKLTEYCMHVEKPLEKKDDSTRHFLYANFFLSFAERVRWMEERETITICFASQQPKFESNENTGSQLKRSEQ